MKNRLQALIRRNPLEDQQGAAVVELGLCIPLLLLVVFGLIDFSQIIFDHQMMSGISRQGSNLASRNPDMTLQDDVSALVTQGASMGIGTNGRILISKVRNNNGVAQVVDQAVSATGIPVTSAIGSAGSTASMPASATTVLNANQTIYVTEVFYSYTPMTPIGNFLKTSLTSTLYESAYF
jgi:Flp pilus assembly protein TadG